MWGQDGWILDKFFFACLWTKTKSRSLNSQKKNETVIKLNSVFADICLPVCLDWLFNENWECYFIFLLPDVGSRCRKTCALNTSGKTLGLPLKLGKYLLFAGLEVRMVKNCDRGLDNGALGLRHRATVSSPKWKVSTLRTDREPALVSQN